MKQKLFAFATTGALITSLLVQCQAQSLPAPLPTATKTQLNDSLVLLPKQLVKYMLQDLTQADSDRIELNLLDSIRIEQNLFISKQSEILNKVQKSGELMEQLYHEKCIVADSLEQSVYMLQKDKDKLIKQKSFWTKASGILGALTLILLL